MFTTYKNKVIEILKYALPGDLVPDDQIVAGSIVEPEKLPTVAFTAGDFEVLQDGQIMDIPKDTEELCFRLSSSLEVWANNLKEVEEIIFKAMAAILVHTKTIEKESNSEFIMGNLKLSFVNSLLTPLKGVTLINNNSDAAKGEVTYAIESLMTVTQLDFDFERIEVIDTFLRKPREISFQISSSFKLTEQSLESLRCENIPEEILKALEEFLKDQYFEKEKEFLNAVKKQIGEKQTISFKELILKHAKSSQTKSPRAILGFSVLAIRGLGPAKSGDLSEKNITTIRELALAEKNQLIGISKIEDFIQKARDVRRIANEVVEEILAEHPFPGDFLINEILQKSVDEIKGQTGKSREKIEIFCGYLRELQEKISKDYFKTLKLTDFI